MDNDKDFEEQLDDAIDSLILNGLIEVSSIDENTGEFLYSMSPRLLEAIPNIAEETEKMFLSTLNDLWVKGFVAMDVTQTNPKVTLTDLAFDEDSVSALPYQERITLYIIIESMRNNGEV